MEEIYGVRLPGSPVPALGDYMIPIGRYWQGATAKTLTRYGPQTMAMCIASDGDSERIMSSIGGNFLRITWGSELEKGSELQLCLMPSGKFQIWPAPTPYGLAVAGHVANTLAENHPNADGQAMSYRTEHTYDVLYRLTHPGGPVVPPMEQEADHTGVTVCVTPEHAKDSNVPGFRYILPSGPNPMRYWVRNRCGDGLQLMTAPGRNTETFSDGSDQTLRADTTAYVVWDPTVDMHSVHTVSDDTHMHPSASQVHCSIADGIRLQDVTKGTHSLRLVGQWSGSRAVRIVADGHPVATYAGQYPGYREYTFSVHLTPERMAALANLPHPVLPLRVTVDHRTVLYLSIPLDAS